MKQETYVERYEWFTIIIHRKIININKIRRKEVWRAIKEFFTPD